MTVGELVDELHRFDPDARVGIECAERMSHMPRMKGGPRKLHYTVGVGEVVQRNSDTMDRVVLIPMEPLRED